MRTAPCESTPRRLAHTSTSASVAAPSAVMPFAAKMSVKTRNSSDWSTRMAPIACTFFAEDRTAGRGSLAEPAASVQDCGSGTASALPLPLLQGERVGVRGSASPLLVEAPLTPTLSPRRAGRGSADFVLTSLYLLLVRDRMQRPAGLARVQLAQRNPLALRRLRFGLCAASVHRAAIMRADLLGRVPARRAAPQRGELPLQLLTVERELRDLPLAVRPLGGRRLALDQTALLELRDLVAQARLGALGGV